MNGREMTVAAIQMSPTPNKEENLETAELLTRLAVSSGAELVALPELWSCHGLEKVYKENAEPVPGPTTGVQGGQPLRCGREVRRRGQYGKATRFRSLLGGGERGRPDVRRIRLP